jgi:hypothetical protein
MESDHHFIGDDAVTDDDNKKREEAAAVLLWASSTDNATCSPGIQKRRCCPLCRFFIGQEKPTTNAYRFRGRLNSPSTLHQFYPGQLFNIDIKTTLAIHHTMCYYIAVVTSI